MFHKSAPCPFLQTGSDAAWKVMWPRMTLDLRSSFLHHPNAYRHLAPHLVYAVLGVEDRALYMLGKH